EDRQALEDVVEPMFDVGRNEDDTPRTDLAILRAHTDPCATADDIIHLVFSVGRLLVLRTSGKFVEPAAHRRDPQELEVRFAPPPPRDQPPPAWVPRPEDYQVPPSWAGPAPRPVGPSNLPKIAAVFLLLSGILGMAGAIANAVSLPSVSDYANFTNNSPEFVAFIQICGLVSIWSQALAILGGVMAWQRMNWKLTLVCAVFALFTLGSLLIVASLVGLVGLIFTIVARRYFGS